MHRYWVFGGSSFYPTGGAYDFKRSFDAMLEAQEYAASMRCDWWHVVDTKSGRIVESPVRNPFTGEIVEQESDFLKEEFATHNQRLM